MTPSTERAAPAPPSHLRPDGNPESLGDGAAEEPRELLPRETGHDIGTMSPVPLSAEVVGIITRLRNMKVQHSFHPYCPVGGLLNENHVAV